MKDDELNTKEIAMIMTTAKIVAMRVLSQLEPTAASVQIAYTTSLTQAREQLLGHGRPAPKPKTPPKR